MYSNESLFMTISNTTRDKSLRVFRGRRSGIRLVGDGVDDAGGNGRRVRGGGVSELEV